MVRIPSQIDDRGLRYIGPKGTSFGRDVYLVNPNDRDWTRHRYVLHFGAYGWTRLMVWANDLDSAIEDAAEWLAKHAPGHVMQEWSDEHKDLVREVCEEQGGSPWKIRRAQSLTPTSTLRTSIGHASATPKVETRRMPRPLVTPALMRPLQRNSAPRR